MRNIQGRFLAVRRLQNSRSNYRFQRPRQQGHWIGKSEFERLAILQNIQIRTGGVCNPGGIACALRLSPSEMRDNFREGVRCGNDLDEINGKPTGIVRVSLGAMSSRRDVDTFLRFLQTFINTCREEAKPLHPRKDKSDWRASKAIRKGGAYASLVSNVGEKGATS